MTDVSSLICSCTESQRWLWRIRESSAWGGRPDQVGGRGKADTSHKFVCFMKVLKPGDTCMYLCLFKLAGILRKSFRLILDPAPSLLTFTASATNCPRASKSSWNGIIVMQQLVFVHTYSHTVNTRGSTETFSKWKAYNGRKFGHSILFPIVE